MYKRATALSISQELFESILEKDASLIGLRKVLSAAGPEMLGKSVGQVVNAGGQAVAHNLWLEQTMGQIQPIRDRLAGVLRTARNDGALKAGQRPPAALRLVGAAYREDMGKILNNGVNLRKIDPEVVRQGNLDVRLPGHALPFA